MSECKHGLDEVLCDICSPKAEPIVVRPTRASGPRVTRIAGTTTSKKSINVAQHRVYHVTHISNLESILDADELRADAAPSVDLSTELTRELRRTAEVAPGASVADHVAFYLSPDATRWEQILGGAEDETHWSAAARTSAPADFVFLVSTVGALGESVVIADGDAAATYTRFSTGDSVRSSLEKLRDAETAVDAEALVPGAFPFAAVQLIGVANDRVRDRVRELTATKVAVYPPWFLLAE